MTDTAIEDLTDGTTANATDRIPVTRDPTGTPVNRYITPDYIETFMRGRDQTWAGAHAFARGTITDPSPSVAITQTWNDAADTFVAFDVDITATASAANSMLMRFKDSVGNGMFGIRRAQNSGGRPPQLVWHPSGNPTLMYMNDEFSFILDVRNGGGNYTWGNNGLFSLSGSAAGINIGSNLSVTRDANDVLAQRRGTNPQAFRIYNTYTDASNYERLNIGWASNALTIGTAAAGTGTKRNVVLDGANRAAHSTTASDIAAALVAHGIMAAP